MPRNRIFVVQLLQISVTVQQQQRKQQIGRELEQKLIKGTFHDTYNYYDYD